MADPTAPVEFVDPSGAGGPYGDGTWPFNVARTDDGNGWHLGLQTLSSENHNYRNPTHPFPFSIDLFPFDGGLGPGKAYAPRSYVPSTAGATVYKDMVLGPLQRVGITLTSSSAQGTRAVSWNSALWILCGTEVCKIDSALTVSANRALGAVGTWISVVGGELFVSMGQAGFIQKQTTAGVWSTSADVRAFSIEVVRNLVWRLGGAASGVDNSMSSITAIGANVATNAMTVANYNTAAGYKAGDASYQGSFIIDYGGVPWVGRPDGMFAPDPETKFVNQTPQLGAAPHSENTKGCFPGDTKISFDDTIEEIHRRWYSGRIWRIRTTNGYEVSGTPNHPILTSKGWIPLRLLNIGDDIVSVGFGGVVQSAQPNIQYIEASLEQVFSTCAEIGTVHRVVGGTMDFHGDGEQGEVDVIALDRELLNRVKSALNEHVAEKIFASANFDPAIKSTYGSVGHFQDRALLPDDSTALSQRLTNRGRRHAHRMADVDRTDTTVIHVDSCGDVNALSQGLLMCGENAVDMIVGNPKGDPQRSDVCSIPISSNEFGVIASGLGRIKGQTALNPGLFKGYEDSAFADSEPLGKGAARFSAPVCFDKIVQIETGDFAGHVYNLQTSTHRYFANNIVAHNSFTAKGYLWVPTVKGLLRCERGVSRRVGPETTDTPTINWWVRGGVEFDDSIYLLAEDYGTVNGTMYLLQMQEDPHGISTGEYIYHLRGVATASLANAGRFITLFTNPTNPTLIYGGGSLVTSANKVSLSRGSGREYSDASVGFEPGALDTGPFLFSPVETCFMALFVGIEGAAYVPASSSLSFSYSVDQYNPAAAPSTAMLSEQETGGGVQAISASGRFRRYAARGAYGHIGEVLCTFGGTGKAILKDLRAFGWLIPGPTDLFTVKLVLGDLDETFHNTGPGIGAFDQLLALRAWKRDGTVLLGRIEDYETGHNDRFIISSVAAEATAVTLAGGETHRFALTATVAFARIDYQNLYAT